LLPLTGQAKVFSAVWAALAAAQHVTIEAVNIPRFCCSSASPVQAGVSSELNKDLAAPIWNALFVYTTELAGVLLIQLIVRQICLVGALETARIDGSGPRYSQHRINIDGAYARAKTGSRPLLLEFR
jgi:hypothetical protein